nr:MAG TPA: hypothetical protein [Caudoviricetes sp.]DAX98986.1 MAG TPA: hypothetical protein [Caudoviricetes sp.]
MELMALNGRMEPRDNHKGKTRALTVQLTVW